MDWLDDLEWLTAEQRAALREQDYTTTAAVLEATSAESVAHAAGITCGLAGRLRAAARTWRPKPVQEPERADDELADAVAGLDRLPPEVRADARKAIRDVKMAVQNGGLSFYGTSKEVRAVKKALGYS